MFFVLTAAVFALRVISKIKDEAPPKIKLLSFPRAIRRHFAAPTRQQRILAFDNSCAVGYAIA